MVNISSLSSNSLLLENDVILCVDERKKERKDGRIHVETTLK
jgi:hypothetical protein